MLYTSPTNASGVGLAGIAGGAFRAIGFLGAAHLDDGEHEKDQYTIDS